MKVPRASSRGSFGFNMTPMIDVVFQLIIFFLVASHFARNETQLDLRLPVARSGAEDTDFETPRVTINVKADGTLWLSGREIAPERLTAQLTEVRSAEGDNLEVRIRGSRAATYADVEPIMRSCTEAGIWNVSYAVYREEPR
ncbi:MAG: ExbD/TolR family protein [Planctomycetota bacterium]|jgi:biopolymer transport protein ExbD|nr:biopolymer transporter ExbD [Blastopirellula sp.]